MSLEQQNVSLMPRGPGTTIAGGGSDVADIAQDVVEVEGAAAGRSATTAVRVLLFSPTTEPHEVDLNAVPELIQHDENFVWVDVGPYAAADLQQLVLDFGLPRRAARTALSPWHRPRIDLYERHFFASATVARLEPERYSVHAAELDLFVGNNILLSAHKHELPFGEEIANRAVLSPELVQLDAAYMLFIILDELVAHYEDLLEVLQTDVEKMQLLALRQTSDVFLERLVCLKRYVFAFNHLATQHRDVFKTFLRPDFPYVSDDEVEEYFEDLEGRLERLLDQLVVTNTAVTDAFDIYVSHMSHQTNQVIKLLTMVSTILLPTTVIVSIFGTNLAVSIHNAPLKTPIGLIVMFVCIALVTTGTLWTFRRRHWL